MFVQFNIDSNFEMERASTVFYLCIFLEWHAAGMEYTIGELIDHDDSLDQSYLVFMLILRRSDGQFVAIT